MTSLLIGMASTLWCCCGDRIHAMPAFEREETQTTSLSTICCFSGCGVGGGGGSRGRSQQYNRCSMRWPHQLLKNFGNRIDGISRKEWHRSSSSSSGSNGTQHNIYHNSLKLPIIVISGSQNKYLSRIPTQRKPAPKRHVVVYFLGGGAGASGRRSCCCHCRRMRKKSISVVMWCFIYLSIYNKAKFCKSKTARTSVCL